MLLFPQDTPGLRVGEAVSLRDRFMSAPSRKRVAGLAMANLF